MQKGIFISKDEFEEKMTDLIVEESVKGGPLLLKILTIFATKLTVKLFDESEE